MERTQLSIKTLINQAWTSYSDYALWLLPLFILLLLPGGLDSFLSEYLFPRIPGASVETEAGIMLVGQRAIIASILSAIFGVITAWLQIGYVNNELEALNLEKPQAKTLFSGNFKQLLSMIG